MSEYVKESVNQVYHHLLIGGSLAVITVLAFLLNIRSTFISAMVLPTSIMATFMMLTVMGFTINFMTLMALQLAIGLLIDDAIVVQENIMRHVEAGKPARLAAAFATKEIGLAVLATTLSVVAVFMPTAFTKGIVGQFFFPFGMTIAFAVLISMFVSFTLDPMLSSRMLKKITHHNVIFRGFEAAFHWMERVYAHMLGWSIRWRWIVVVIAFFAFVGSMVIGGAFAKSEFAPVEDRSEFQIAMRSKLGSSLAETRDVMEKLRAEVIKLPEVSYTVFTIGGTSSGGAESKVTAGSMYVKLLPKHDRQSKKLRSQQEIMNALRDSLARVDGPVAVSVQIFDAVGNSTGQKSSQLQLDILGNDLASLDRFSQQLLKKMQAAGQRYKDIDTTYETGRPEISVFVDRERAADRGVSPADVAETIRAGIGGVDIGKFRSGKDRYDIAMRLLESGRNRPDSILQLDVPSQKPGAAVELRTVATIAPSEVPVEINRLNRQRQITILANPGKDDKNRDVVLGDATAEIDKFIAEIGKPEGVRVAWTGQKEIMDESFANLGFTMLLSVAVVFMVLAAQFESIVHPFTIMLSLPLAFVGAVLGLVIFQQTLNIFTMMAFIFLLGLVTKNAILLIDYANTLRTRDGFSRDDAIRRAGPVRLRPILMTTFAMIVGMLPTALGTGEGAESRQPMAIAIIGGLVSSTFLTLLVVPSVYSILDPISEWMRTKIIDRGVSPTPAAPPQDPNDDLVSVGNSADSAPIPYPPPPRD
jgi:HAE1 family hydrophobic/amphiphilic exporter-1